jgi:hypothetical protein
MITMSEKITFEYPTSLIDFDRFTFYQVKDFYSSEWSETKQVGKMCRDVQNTLLMLLAGKRIRIVKCENDTC